MSAISLRYRNRAHLSTQIVHERVAAMRVAIPGIGHNKEFEPAPRAIRQDIATGRFWSVSAGCWQVSISPVPAIDGQALPTRSSRSIFSEAVVQHPGGARSPPQLRESAPVRRSAAELSRGFRHRLTCRTKKHSGAAEVRENAALCDRDSVRFYTSPPPRNVPRAAPQAMEDAMSFLILYAMGGFVASFPAGGTVDSETDLSGVCRARRDAVVGVSQATRITAISKRGRVCRGSPHRFRPFRIGPAAVRARFCPPSIACRRVLVIIGLRS